jgi:hypothetical protein
MSFRRWKERGRTPQAQSQGCSRIGEPATARSWNGVHPDRFTFPCLRRQRLKPITGTLHLLALSPCEGAKGLGSEALCPRFRDGAGADYEGNTGKRRDAAWGVAGIRPLARRCFMRCDRPSPITLTFWAKGRHPQGLKLSDTPLDRPSSVQGNGPSGSGPIAERGTDETSRDRIAFRSHERNVMVQLSREGRGSGCRMRRGQRPGDTGRPRSVVPLPLKTVARAESERGK